jgi:hypothetical protein
MRDRVIKYIEEKGKIKIFPVVISILLLFCVPVVINFLVQYNFLPIVFGTGNDWLGFFGAYLGGAIGAVIAVYVARLQASKAEEEFQNNREYEHQIRQQENRVFTSFTWELADWKLKNTDIKTAKIKILNTYDYKRRELSLDHKKVNMTTFAKINLLGNSPFVTNFKFIIKVNPFKKELNVNPMDDLFGELPRIENEIMELTIPLVLTDTKLYIPITNIYLNPVIDQKRNLCVHRAYNISNVTIEYTTPLLEKIRFDSNINQKYETHTLITDGKEKLIMESEMQNISWTEPNKVIIDQKSDN